MRYHTLITAETLSGLSDCTIIDCRFSLADPGQGEQLYRQGHIPGALYAHLDHDLSSKITPDSGRHPLPDFEELANKLRKWGLTPGNQVVVYDDASGFFASRLWWLLRTLGHEGVAVLDGGIQAWEANRLPLDRHIPSITPSDFPGHINDKAWVDVADVQQGLLDNSLLLIDARARERFDGINEPIDPVAGHIPGSVNLPSTDNLDQGGRFLPTDQVREQYLGVMGKHQSEQVVHSCGSGVFACFGVLAMEYAGLSGSKIYPGSWSEWIRDPERPIASAA